MMSVTEKKQGGEVIEVYGLKEGENTILSRQPWQGLTEKVAIEQNLKQVKECAVCVSGSGKGFPGRDNRK